jgi:D-alanine--poly(phosphoribitol) ligase subunit 2
MADNRAAIIAAVRRMLETLASNLGNDASGVGEDDIIPDIGVLDSAGIVEFVMTIDNAFDLDLDAEDMTVDNLGSLAAIASFIEARQA